VVTLRSWCSDDGGYDGTVARSEWEVVDGSAPVRSRMSGAGDQRAIRRDAPVHRLDYDLR
jgi:hypothetical protein